ncbi:hypothetical protein PYCCODRAFT_876554 [Trametes coccinea BRFM310]|uniref:Uncharacterized protein n=1 Tax=Trametes coccinea (strain BRFM310) TaxID=1353009 RepID=A0A1Y2IDH9_TRAC3|nr:hypothetical protein PYCCODRAFT_876554 [Trametes coccinea BRFM310]
MLGRPSQARLPLPFLPLFSLSPLTLPPLPHSVSAASVRPHCAPPRFVLVPRSVLSHRGLPARLARQNDALSESPCWCCVGCLKWTMDERAALRAIGGEAKRANHGSIDSQSIARSSNSSHTWQVSCFSFASFSLSRCLSASRTVPRTLRCSPVCSGLCRSLHTELSAPVPRSRPTRASFPTAASWPFHIIASLQPVASRWPATLRQCMRCGVLLAFGGITVWMLVKNHPQLPRAVENAAAFDLTAALK